MCPQRMCGEKGQSWGTGDLGGFSSSINKEALFPPYEKMPSGAGATVWPFSHFANARAVDGSLMGQIRTGRREGTAEILVLRP